MSATAWDPERPWARQPFDTELGFALLGDYLALAIPRKTSNLLRSGCPLDWAQLEKLSIECYWRERAACWDEHLAHIRETTIERVTEETAEQVARRQLSLTRLMQSLAAIELGSLEEHAKKAKGFPGTIQPRDATRLAFTGIKLERLILGEATDRTETGPDVSSLSIEELREARRLQAKMGVR